MLRLRSLHSRESHSLTNSGYQTSIYKKVIGISDDLFIYLLFFLKFFDLVEDFCGLAYDLAVDA